MRCNVPRLGVGLCDAALSGLTPTKHFMADNDEPLFSKLSDEELLNAIVSNDNFYALTRAHVSDEVRKECEAEMEAAKKRGWKYK